MGKTCDLGALYDALDSLGVDVFTCPFSASQALAHPDGYLAIDTARLGTEAEERAVLIHEEGHFATGTFYQLDSPYTVRKHQENVASRYGYRKYFPLEEILNAMDAGCLESWQLAEYFGMPQAYIEEMLAYYVESRGVDFERERARRRSLPGPSGPGGD